MTQLESPVVGAGAGTIEFRLYAPGDTNCTGASILPNPIIIPMTVTGATTGTATSAPPYTPLVAGTYRWRAFFSGDANNLPVDGPCNAANENTIVRAQPLIPTTASADISLGGTLTDVANVTGLVDPVVGAGAGTVEFRLYGPNDANCTGGSILPNPIVVPLTLTSPTAGTATSTPAFTPTVAGTYRWRAFYSGDLRNDPANGPCNAPGESTIVRAPAADPDDGVGDGLGGWVADRRCERDGSSSIRSSALVPARSSSGCTGRVIRTARPGRSFRTRSSCR